MAFGSLWKSISEPKPEGFNSRKIEVVSKGEKPTLTLLVRFRLLNLILSVGTLGFRPGLPRGAVPCLALRPRLRGAGVSSSLGSSSSSSSSCSSTTSSFCGCNFNYNLVALTDWVQIRSKALVGLESY